MECRPGPNGPIGAKPVLYILETILYYIAKINVLISDRYGMQLGDLCYRSMYFLKMNTFIYIFSVPFIR